MIELWTRPESKKSALIRANADLFFIGASDGIRTRAPRSHSAVLYR